MFSAFWDWIVVLNTILYVKPSKDNERYESQNCVSNHKYYLRYDGFLHVIEC
jgi:hypothetical protein